MKRDKRFDLVNELSKAVMDKTVYEHTLGTGDDASSFKMNTNSQKLSKEEHKKQQQKEEQEILEKLYAQRKSGR